ncbi:hypothetical protein BDV93DRAFT_514591 [Ceratobasidium sp. AG-I]|nr:hypothetical protein BDV93DRAFT_514591 [Ceratobasidium sp. AG-I]
MNPGSSNGPRVASPKRFPAASFDALPDLATLAFGFNCSRAGFSIYRLVEARFRASSAHSGCMRGLHLACHKATPGTRAHSTIKMGGRQHFHHPTNGSSIQLKPYRSPSSSLASIRDSQPQPHSPTSTARGTERHHALFNAPPLKALSPPSSSALTARESSPRTHATLLTQSSVEYQTCSIPSAAKSNVAASQPNPAPASTSNPCVTNPASSAPRRPKSHKQPSLRFGDEASSGKDDNPRPRKTCNTGTSENSPPPKPPGCGAAVAAGGLQSRRQPTPSPVGKQQSVTLTPAVARELKSIIGLNLSTSTAKSVREQAHTLSNPNPLPMGSAQHYTQVQRQVPPSVPLLKNKGTYQRDRLLALATPNAPQTQNPPSRRPVNMSEPTSTDRITACFPSPPPLPTFYHPRTPEPVSSTQRAVVNSSNTQTTYTAVQPRTPFTSDYQPSPIPQPGSQFEQANNPSRPFQRRSSSPQTQSPCTEPSTAIPDHNIPSPTLNSPSPEPSRSARRPPTPHLAMPPPDLDPNSATMSETESEPTLKPKPGRKRCRRSRHRSKRRSQADSSGHASNIPVPNAGRAPSFTCPDNHTLFQHLNQSLENNGHNADIDMDTLLALVNEVRRKQRSHTSHPSTSRAAPSVPVSCDQSGFEPTASASRGRAGPASRCDSRQHPDKLDEEDSGNESSDDEYDPILLDKTGLGRYPGMRGKVASCAIPKMMSTASKKGVYQDHNTSLKWANNAYQRAWKENYSHVTYWECPKDLHQTMSGPNYDRHGPNNLQINTRVSNLRTLVKDQIRKIVRFDTVPKNDQYEDCALIVAIYEAFFWSPDSFFIPDCPALKERDEGLPLPTIAFVLTMMQECIEEWATGQFLSRDLNLMTQQGRFDSHLWGLLNYRNKAWSRLLRFQRRWLDGGLEHTSVQVNKEEPEPYHCQSVTQPKNVCPNTPPALNSESEPEEDQHLNTCVKGKGKGKAN